MKRCRMAALAAMAALVALVCCVPIPGDAAAPDPALPAPRDARLRMIMEQMLLPGVTCSDTLGFDAFDALAAEGGAFIGGLYEMVSDPGTEPPYGADHYRVELLETDPGARLLLITMPEEAPYAGGAARAYVIEQASQRFYFAVVMRDAQDGFDLVEYRVRFSESMDIETNASAIFAHLEPGQDELALVRAALSGELAPLPKPAPRLTDFRARFQMEFYVLPEYAFSGGANAMQAIEQSSGDALVTLFAEIYGDAQVPYAPSDFRVTDVSKDGEPMRILRIDMPEKNLYAGLCRRIYLCFDPDGAQMRYFSVERHSMGPSSVEGRSGLPLSEPDDVGPTEDLPDMLCFVAEDMTHGTYRSLAIGEDELEHILTIIRENQEPAATSKGG